MGKLPVICPPPGRVSFTKRQQELLEAHNKSEAWRLTQLEKMYAHAARNGILSCRWGARAYNWMRLAIMYESEQREEGRRAYASQCVGVGGNGPSRSANSPGGQPNGSIPELARKIDTYQAWLKSNPKLAQEYLERQPARVRRAILDSVCS
jgi:hypothetical protein